MTPLGSVYALTTPQGTPFYVGATVQSVGTRVGQHLRDARTARRVSPVHQLLAQTNRCGVWVLESQIPADLLGRRERRHKFAIERSGFELLNYHHGANGCRFQPRKVRERIAAYAAKRPRGLGGQFVTVPVPIAGAAPSEAELFMGP